MRFIQLCSRSRDGIDLIKRISPEGGSSTYLEKDTDSTLAITVESSQAIFILRMPLSLFYLRQFVWLWLRSGITKSKAST